ncbi:DUF3179 domain-containing (seleno)protein [Labrenzia sp. VG12]|uniref:DUF3179 domain-containing (seleno)protein n=1 Tax=Labrenzia sp. VG12 TaxID=2021862 RepID=UPI000B8C53FD|nr:DUF3179 domain-containing (seleno)protein [Labrenzia sp. VG12]ASP35803.1 hypothetical protein CHH27_23285 [Labrenzia sp. VG12]
MSLVANLLFYAGLVVALGIGGLYFRDLGDVTQMFLKVKRENMARFIRNEYRLVALGVTGLVIMTAAHFLLGGGLFWLWLIAFLLGAVLLVFPYVWVHVGLRNQKTSAQYFPISEASEWVSPSSPVIVIENNGIARAHPDAQIMRPHLAGNKDGLDGENVIMTYCAMANLGVGYTPTVAGEALDLEVLAQHSNNLILRDNRTGEPIQQIFGFRDRDASATAEGTSCPVKPELAMKPWPTFRMTMRGFSKAYPDGTVFINKPASNPLLRLFDLAIETIFSSEIARQHRVREPIIQNMSRSDDRLHNKTYVWGVVINGDVVCWTDDFVVEQGNVVNASVGGRDLVVAWDPKFESLGIWYNDTGAPVTDVDVFGKTPAGQLTRVETVRPGMFWHVWADFFPHTDINRIGSAVRSESPETTGTAASEAAQ